uniref:Replicative DNA helicase n=1 Tax=Pterocladia lucida TaxID=31408 RepID=A0A6M3WW87_PTELU|nr:dnaB [Pterocladia lucida]
MYKYKQENYHFSPHNCLAEEILLGTILIYPNIFSKISHRINCNSFFLECHQIIYRNLNSLNKNKKLDLVNILYILNEKEILKYIGGMDKIIEMMKQSQIFISSTNTIIYIQEIIELINRNYTKRLMIQYGYNMIQLAFINKLPNYVVYNKASYYLNSVVDRVPKKNITNVKDLIGKFLIESNNKNIFTKFDESFKCGFKEIDKLTHGFSKGDLIILAGRPSMGKTSFAINIAYYTISNYILGLCIFSLEMSKEQIFNKLISIASQIPIYKIVSNQITNQEWESLRTICNKLLNYTIYINDNPNLSIDKIIYTCQTLSKDKNYIQMMIIDYLQLIQIENTNNISRSQELSYITRKLKILAQQLNIPIIVLSQLNRSIENRVNKKPMLSDLKESGCIEHNQLINFNIINEIHIKYFLYNNSIITSYLYNVLDYINNKCLKKIHTSYKNNYKIVVKQINTITTNNHQIFSRKHWLREDKISERELIYTYLTKKTKYLHGYYLIYVNNIYFFQYSQVYDIILPKHRNFVSNDIIVHNSIEQDADIVMILYKSTYEYNIENNESIITDMILCKNRNGPTGSCKFLFTPKNTHFKDFKEKTNIISL